jgi:hypothetical protein
MEKYITNIKDLVIQFMTNGKEMEAKAKEGDAASCFQMGMVHLLGIKASVDFKKASQYFSNQSLADDADAKRLLGLIAEYEGNYSLAFENYANVAGGNSKQSYIETVIKERGNLQSFLKKLDLPTELNKEVSAILVDYVRGGKSKSDAIFKIATICDDQPSAILVAQYLCEVEQYNWAKRWLQNGNVPISNSLYATIEKKETDQEKELYQTKVLEVIEIEGNVLMDNSDIIPSFVNIDNKCNEVGTLCKQEFSNTTLKMIDAIKKQKEEEDACRRREEEARRRKEEEEEARKKKEEEEARRRREEEARRRREEEEEARKKKEEEERFKKKRRKYNVIMICIYVVFLIVMQIGLYNEKAADVGLILYVPVCLAFSLLLTIVPYVVIWWIIRSYIK